MDGVRLVSVSSALLDQGSKGHRQDVFTLPRALAGSGYLGQLQKETKPQLQLQNTWKMRHAEARDVAPQICTNIHQSIFYYSHTCTEASALPRSHFWDFDSVFHIKNVFVLFIAVVFFKGLKMWYLQLKTPGFIQTDQVLAINYHNSNDSFSQQLVVITLQSTSSFRWPCLVISPERLQAEGTTNYQPAARQESKCNQTRAFKRHATGPSAPVDGADPRSSVKVFRGTFSGRHARIIIYSNTSTSWVSTSFFFRCLEAEPWFRHALV